MKIEKLCIEIEEVRERLNELCKNLGDEKYKDKILNISIKMDELIVKYTNLKNDNC